MINEWRNPLHFRVQPVAARTAGYAFILALNLGEQAADGFPSLNVFPEEP